MSYPTTTTQPQILLFAPGAQDHSESRSVKIPVLTADNSVSSTYVGLGWHTPYSNDSGGHTIHDQAFLGHSNDVTSITLNCDPDNFIPNSSDLNRDDLDSGENIPDMKGVEDRQHSGVDNGNTPFTTGPYFGPLHRGYYKTTEPNSDVEATNELLDLVNPFEITISQGPTGIAPTLKCIFRMLYLSILLFLPRLYFSRVERILKSAEMSMEDMEHMVVVGLGKWNRRNDRIPVYIQNSPMYPAFMQFSSTWDLFIRSLMKEWKTLNIASILLSTTILTLLQINTTASDPLIRNPALMSLICALMSLLYACLYTVRFAVMKKAHKALEWAEEAKLNGKVLFWNVWVLLALPAIWLAWSFILFMVSVLAFTWRAGASYAPPPELVSPLGRIGITMLFAIGLFYLILVLVTLRTYGRTMDRKWQERVEKWTKKHRTNLTFSPTPDQVLSMPSSAPFNSHSSQIRNPEPFPPASTYTPVYIQHSRLPSCHEHQFPPDMTRFLQPQIPHDGIVNVETNTSFSATQALHARENHQFCLRTPTDSDPRFGSRRSSPAIDARHHFLPYVTEQPGGWSQSFTPSLDTTYYHSMNSSIEGIVPSRRPTPVPSPLKSVAVASDVSSEDVAQPNPIRPLVSVERFVPPSPQISEPSISKS